MPLFSNRPDTFPRSKGRGYGGISAFPAMHFWTAVASKLGPTVRRLIRRGCFGFKKNLVLISGRQLTLRFSHKTQYGPSSIMSLLGRMRVPHSFAFPGV